MQKSDIYVSWPLQYSIKQRNGRVTLVEQIDKKYHPEESGLVHETNLVQGLAIPTD